MTTTTVDRSHKTCDWCSYSLLVVVTVAVAAAEVEADVRGLHLEEARAADHHGRHDGGDDVDQGPVIVITIITLMSIIMK